MDYITEAIQFTQNGVIGLKINSVTFHFTHHAYFSKHLCNDVQHFTIPSQPDIIQMRCTFREETGVQIIT